MLIIYLYLCYTIHVSCATVVGYLERLKGKSCTIRLITFLGKKEPKKRKNSNHNLSNHAGYSGGGDIVKYI